MSGSPRQSCQYPCMVYLQTVLLFTNVFLEQKELCSCQVHCNKSYIYEVSTYLSYSFTYISNNLESVHETHMAQRLAQPN